MKFYKENNINPAASCLPILAQIPIFIALFFVLRDFEEEILPQFPDANLDWLGLVTITENAKVGWGPLLIVIYAVSQLASTYFMSTTMQGAQRVLLMVLPIAFVPFILNFPAGLVLYWVTTNLWTTGPGPRHAAADAEERSRRRSARRARRRSDDGSAGNGRRTSRAAAEARARHAGAGATREAEEEGAR